MKGVEFDFSEVKDALNKSLGYELHEAKEKAIDDGLKVIQDKAISNLKSTGIHVSSEMIDGIRREVSPRVDEGIVYHRGRGYYGIKGDYRLLWFDQGTRPRYIDVKGGRKSRGKKMDSLFKSGNRQGYRGQITPTNFFTNAKNEIPKAIDITMNKITKNLTDILNGN